MTSRIHLAIVTVCLLATPAFASAQSDVTFKVPLKLTQVSSDIAKVAVVCTISSAAITINRAGSLQKQEEFPLSGGRLVTTATVVVAVANLDDPVGKTASYDCRLWGFSTSLQLWDVFNETQAVAAFRLKPTPAPITGSFAW